MKKLVYFLAIATLSASAHAIPRTSSGLSNESSVKTTVLPSKKLSKFSLIKRKGKVPEVPPSAVTELGEADVLPSTQTTTTTSEAVKPKELKEFGASIVLQAENPTSHIENGKHTSWFSVNYSPNEKNKYEIRQHITGEFSSSPNSYTASLSRIEGLYSHLFDVGILNSEALKPTFRILLPGSDQKAIAQKSRLITRVDLEPEWKITPNTSISYLFSPRASFFDTNELEDADPKKQLHFENTVSLLHQVKISYAFSDHLNVYSYVGMRHGAFAQTMTYVAESNLAALGLEYGKGAFFINPELGNETFRYKPTTLNGPITVEGDEGNFWSPNQLNLSVTAGVNF